MHLDADPHPHPHPHPERRTGVLPWILIAGILGLAAFFALRNPPGPSGEPPPGGAGTAPPAELTDQEVLDRYQRGVALLEQYNYAEAYDCFLAVTKARPGWDAAQFNAGLAALNLLDKYFPAAEAHLREALRLNPRNLHPR